MSAAAEPSHFEHARERQSPIGVGGRAVPTCRPRPKENDRVQGALPCSCASLLIAFRFTVASSSLCPPLRNTIPGTAGGTFLDGVQGANY